MGEGFSIWAVAIFGGSLLQLPVVARDSVPIIIIRGSGELWRTPSSIVMGRRQMTKLPSRDTSKSARVSDDEAKRK